MLLQPDIEFSAELNTTTTTKTFYLKSQSDSFKVISFVFSNFFCLLGKQDYKKTKSVLKATRLKAEAKKNSSGFRVRLA